MFLNSFDAFISLSSEVGGPNGMGVVYADACLFLPFQIGYETSYS